MKLSGVMMGSEHTPELIKFYTAIFGEPVWHDDTSAAYAVGGGNLMVSPHSEVHGKNADAPRLMMNLTADDVKAEYERIIKAGATSVAEPYQPDPNNDMWLATVADPDGNYLQISRPWEVA